MPTKIGAINGEKKKMTDLLRKYKNWTYSQNSRHYDEDDEFCMDYAKQFYYDVRGELESHIKLMEDN